MKLKYFDLTNSSELTIQGRSLSEISALVGSTPYYVYDSSVMERKIQELRTHLPKEVKIHYAVKANPQAEVLNFFATRVDGFDLASVGELRQAIKTKMPAREMSFAGPGKLESEIKEALSCGVLIHVESEDELYRVVEAARGLKVHPRIALRINPNFEMKSSGMKMGGGPKQFGIDAEVIPRLLVDLKKNGIAIEGIHIFAGSQNLDAKLICDTFKSSFALLGQYSEALGQELRVFNFGGGFGIPYFEGDQDLKLASIGQTIKDLIPAFKKLFPQAEPVIELGRFLVGEAGVFISKIVERKVSREQIFLILDGGMNCHLGATGNLGQIMKRPFPIVIANKLQEKNYEKVNIVGPLCTPLDSFASQLSVSVAKRGDFVAIFQSGAYGYSASPINFLSHPLAKEIFL